MYKPEFINSGELISDKNYYEWIESVKSRFHSTQARAAIRVNTEMLRFYWSLGRDLVQMKAESRWGAKVVNQVSLDLRQSFPEVKGFSTTNIKYTARWYQFYNQADIIGQRVVDQFKASKFQQPAGDSTNEIGHQLGNQSEMPEIFGRIPWGQHIEIVTHCKTVEEALFYVNETIKNNWSRPQLRHYIDAGLYTSHGSAVTNFADRLPADFATNATSILKDPYIFDFLELPDDYDEHDLEDALVNNITRFLLELGNGFSFIGRQVELRMDDGTSFFPDLLFYNYRTKNFVVAELKVKKFIPEYIGKLNFYVKAVDMLLKGPDDNPTIGLLICREKNKTIVEWSLSDINKPLGVASYELQHKIEATLNAMLYPSTNKNDDEGCMKIQKGCKITDEGGQKSGKKTDEDCQKTSESGKKTDNGGKKSGKETAGNSKKNIDIILELISQNPMITHKELSERIGIVPSAIQKHIENLKAKGILKRVGPDKGGYWEIIQTNE